ncbi:MAG: hypothetical protein EAX96_05755 [Candidatus Lokiarchaeota archaeon]|nr:hypothetical protein [Candidatus Lokiarchaeota archaeon]
MNHCNNSLSEISGLEGVSNLKALLLSNNRISHLIRFDHLKELRVLALNGNKIEPIFTIFTIIQLI